MNNPAQRVDSHQIRLPLIISFIIGLLFFLPNILIPLLQDNPSADYSPLVATTFAVEETVYAAGIREVFDGHFFVNDPQIYENKDSPSYVAILPNLILGLAAKILGSLPRLYLLCDFLCPAVIFLLVYTLLFKITRQAWVSCLGGVTVLIGYVFIPYIPF